MYVLRTTKLVLRGLFNVYFRITKTMLFKFDIIIYSARNISFAKPLAIVRSGEKILFIATFVQESYEILLIVAI